MQQQRNRLILISSILIITHWLLLLVLVRMSLIWETTLPKAALLGLIFAQLGCLAVWLTSTRERLAGRTALFLAAAAILAQPLSRHTSLLDRQWWTVFVAFAVIVAAANIMMKIGERFSSFEMKTDRRDGKHSLAGLFALTTTIAMGLGAARWLSLVSWSELTLGVALAAAFVGLSMLLMKTPLAWPLAAGCGLLVVVIGSSLPLSAGQLTMAIAVQSVAIVSVFGVLQMAAGGEARGLRLEA